MRVIAIADGFVGTLRRRGEIFELPDDLVETDARGLLVSPKWVKRVADGPEGDARARHFVEVDRLLEEKHFRDGVIAASGKGKAQNFVDMMMQEKERGR